MRSYAIDEKTALRVAKFCVYWRGSDRVEHTRLLGVTIDDRLSWSHHLTDVKNNFVNKLNLPKRSSFLNRNALLDLYFKIILPSVLYGLVVWGGCPNAELPHSLEVLHRRAARIIYNLPRDMPTEEVCRHSNWNTLTLYYKLRLIKLLHSVFIGSFILDKQTLHCRQLQKE